MSWIDDAPHISVWLPEERTARIEHICMACKKPILAGTEYYRLFSVEDGRPQVWKAHDSNMRCKYAKLDTELEDDE